MNQRGLSIVNRNRAADKTIFPVTFFLQPPNL